MILVIPVHIIVFFYYNMHEVGFEPTSLSTAELKSAPLTTRASVLIEMQPTFYNYYLNCCRLAGD